MQRQSDCRSAFLDARAVVILALCVAAYLIAARTVPAVSRSDRPQKVSQRTLTFAERVVYQRAIEDVYWHQRIWPKERPDSKPSLDAVMSQAQLETKVGDYLRKSQALGDYWQRPITAEQLQAEMDRMAKYTKQPDVLQELFEALGNDPFVIAECLARPVLADHLLSSWYAHDERLHGRLRRRAETELQAHPSVEQMKQLSGSYSEIQLLRSDSAHEEDRPGHDHGLQLNGREWDETVQKLAAMFGDGPVTAGLPAATKLGEDGSPAKARPVTDIKTGVLSALQEDATCLYATTVVEKADHRVRLATVSWPKEPVDSWLIRVEKQMPGILAAPSTGYKLPNVSSTGCVGDSWTSTSGPPDGRVGHTAVWTGSEMIVWGGFEYVFPYPSFNTGARYNPSTDSWQGTSTTDAPTGRYSHTAVWTGQRNDYLGWIRVRRQFVQHRRKV